MPRLQSTYDYRRLIYETSYEGRMAFLGYDSVAKKHKIVRDSVRKCAYDIPIGYKKSQHVVIHYRESILR